ncbi:unnamed protein product, partial [Brenthis ino]
MGRTEGSATPTAVHRGDAQPLPAEAAPHSAHLLLLLHFLHLLLGADAVLIDLVYLPLPPLAADLEAARRLVARQVQALVAEVQVLPVAVAAQSWQDPVNLFYYFIKMYFNNIL